MFQLIGSDGKEYGPISADQVRQWIGEGRAGATTRIRREGEAEWSFLNSAPEFAELFHTPPLIDGRLPANTLPPIVRLFALGFFLAAGVSGLFMLVGWISILQVMRNGSFHPGPSYLAWQAVAAVGLVIRVVSGVGVLRRQNWARILAIVYAGFATLLGLWGITRTFAFLSGMGNVSGILSSPQFVLSNLWSIALIVFNIATAVVFSRPAVRAAFKPDAGTR